MKEIKIKSDSVSLTKKIAEKFAPVFLKEYFFKNKTQAIIFKGNLGAGKTAFILGFLNYFGVKPKAASPTFVIMKKYRPLKNFKYKNQKIENIYHLDAYRLNSKKDLEVLGFEDILKNPQNMILIEWPEKIKGAELKNKIPIKIDYGKKENERIIYLKIKK